jgi:hypothetical protein
MDAETWLLTVASHNQKLIVLVDVVYLHIGISGDYLLLGRKVGALLEFEIAYRTRQSKVAVDAAKVDKATCGLDTCLLGWKLSVAIAHSWRFAYPRSVVCGQRKEASPCP